jgi:hypothetical protein
MRLSSAIRAVLTILTMTAGFGTAVYADGGGIRFNVVKAGLSLAARAVAARCYFTAAIIR